jgi:hypothetical protein
MSWRNEQLGLFIKDGNWVSKCKLSSGRIREIVLGKHADMQRSKASRMHKKIALTLLNFNKAINNKNEGSKEEDKCIV